MNMFKKFFNILRGNIVAFFYYVIAGGGDGNVHFRPL